MRSAVAFTVGFVVTCAVSGLLWKGWPGAIVLGVVAVVCFTGALLGELVAQRMRER